MVLAHNFTIIQTFWWPYSHLHQWMANKTLSEKSEVQWNCGLVRTKGSWLIYLATQDSSTFHPAHCIHITECGYVITSCRELPLQGSGLDSWWECELWAVADGTLQANTKLMKFIWKTTIRVGPFLKIQCGAITLCGPWNSYVQV